MTNPEQLWLLALVLAVCLPIIFLGRASRPRADQPAATRGTALVEPAGKAAEPLPPELRVDPAQLEVVRDNTLERPEEREVFLRLLEILKRARPEQLRRASLGRITYAQLRRQPSQYRGRVVTIQGTVRRVGQSRPPRNQQGIDRYHQLWIEPGDAPSWPIVVVSLELPPGFPSGNEVAEEVEVTGFFFKCWAYLAKDQLRTVPTLLARTVGWERPAAPVTPPRATWQWTSLVMGGGGILVIGAWFLWRWQFRAPPRRPAAGGAPDFSSLGAGSAGRDTEADR